MDNAEYVRPPLKHVEEGLFAAMVAIGVSIVVASIAYTLQCSTQFTCVNDGTCKALYDQSCSFSNVVSPIGYKLYNMSSDVETVNAFTRGVCALGERQLADENGRMRCVRQLSYPDAFVKEIADPTGTSHHERACGQWIKSKSTPDEVTYFSFYDAGDVEKEVIDAIKDDLDIRSSASDVTLFTAACKTMLVNSAVAPSVSIAYHYLKENVGSPSTQLHVLNTLGMLAAHFCEVPIAMGVALGASNKFSLKMRDGTLLSSDQASETLYYVGESSSVRDNVRAFVSMMDRTPESLLSTSSSTNQQPLHNILNGALVQFGISLSNEGIPLSQDLNLTGASVGVYAMDHLNMLTKFIYACDQTTIEHARAYLLASASQCALQVRAVVTGEFGMNSITEQAAASVRLHRNKANSLGRIALESDKYLSSVNDTVLFEASTTTWSMLTRSSYALHTTTPSHASSVCWDATVAVFADALDHRVYQKLVSSRAVSNILGPMITTLKEAVAGEIRSGKLSNMLLPNKADRESFAQAAHNVQFRIAGAERTSQFGRNAEFRRPSFQSTDGPILMMLKQAKAVFFDRIRLALDGSDLCQHPPLYRSTARNAYLLNSAPCAMLFPGILVSPFFHELFDEQSLYSRIGFVIAHEIAHVTSDTQRWNMTAASLLLANYSSSTWIEASADLIAAGAINRTNKVSREQACKHVSQTWCACVPNGYYERVGRTHPPANLRGDRVCDFLM